MTTIEITPPKFDLHGFYEAKIKNALGSQARDRKHQVALLKALINQAYHQGRYDARILEKDNSKWTDR